MKLLFLALACFIAAFAVKVPNHSTILDITTLHHL
jgi:hypothetical protein